MVENLKLAGVLANLRGPVKVCTFEPRRYPYKCKLSILIVSAEFPNWYRLCTSLTLIAILIKLPECKLQPLLSQSIIYLLLLFGFTATLFLIIRAPLLCRTWVFGTSWRAHAWFAAPAARCGTRIAVLLVRFHEFSNKLWTVQILLWLPCVVLTVEVHRETYQHQYRESIAIFKGR